MIEAATGDTQALERRVATLATLQSGSSKAAGSVVPAVCRAAMAFRDGDYAQCASILSPLRKEVARIGGSGAQREVVEDTLLVAMMRGGDVTGATNLFNSRLHRRPSLRDAHWRDRLAI